MKYPDLANINDLISKGLIAVRKHPKFDLYIYNYTKQASADHVWDPTIEACRGLICDADGHVIARPFAKFFIFLLTLHFSWCIINCCSNLLKPTVNCKIQIQFDTQKSEFFY